MGLDGIYFGIRWDPIWDIWDLYNGSNGPNGILMGPIGEGWFCMVLP